MKSLYRCYACFLTRVVHRRRKPHPKVMNMCYVRSDVGTNFFDLSMRRPRPASREAELNGVAPFVLVRVIRQLELGNLYGSRP
jgi:hypothetical protein